MRQDIPTGTVTFLFTDIEGSTRLLQELGNDYADALAEHRRVLREAFARHGGVEVDTQGDAFFVAFARAKDALAAAAEGQNALGGGPLRVRMGLHTGEPLVTEEGYVGIDVHRAARVMAAAHGGQVLVSQATHELIADFPVRDLGEHRLKDLSAPVRLYQLGSEDFPPLNTLEQRLTNLPVQATPLIGREREVAEVSALLGEAEVRLVTLTGPAGTGKTRLALQAAAELLDEFADGVFFVDLAPIAEASLVLPTTARTLGFRESGSEPPEQALDRFLRGKTLLLILDNFEQVSGAGPEVARLLNSAPTLKVLVTSRAPLHLSGERDYRVTPLPQADAAQLFTERARAVRHDFEPDEAVPEICRRLDGLPLAVELAAARARLLPPASILERLEQRLPLLTGGAQDAPKRQQTLRAALDWSHDLLEPDEQRLFAQLSVFAGGRTLEAAEQICEAVGDVFDGFAVLVESSLLQADEVVSGRPRFRMLETIHEYALEKLEASGEAEALRRRHAEYFLRLAEQAEPELKRAHQREWLELLAVEHDNLRAALSWARESGNYDVELRLVGALGRFWYVRSHVSEGRLWVEKALARTGDQPPAARARALTAAGILAGMAADLDRLAETSEERLQLFRELGDLEGVAEALCDLGRVAFFKGDLDDASSLMESARAVSEETGDRWATALARMGLANVALHRGDFEQAQVEAEEAVAVSREIGVAEWLAFALVNLGHAKLSERGSDAMSAYLESLSICREIGAKECACGALDGLAAATVVAGDERRAVILLGASESARAAAGIENQPYEADLHARTNADARQELGESKYDEAFAAGASMPFEEAIDYALGLEAMEAQKS